MTTFSQLEAFIEKHPCSIVKEKNRITFHVLYPRNIEEFLTILEFSRVIPNLPIDKYNIQFENKEAYSLTVDFGIENLGKSATSIIKSDMQGLDLVEGLWLVINYPELLDCHAIDLVKSKYSIECIPTIYKWEGKMYLSAICPDVKDSMCAAPFILE